MPGHGRKKSGKRMPANVQQYFRLLNEDYSKSEARKEAGLGPKKKKVAYGPGHPLWEYHHGKR